MGRVGRYFCVALPFILTVASIIAALIVGLTGVSSNDLYLFRIDVTNLSIDATQLQDIVNNASALVSGQDVDELTNQFQDKIDQAGDKIDQAGQDVSDKAKDIVNRSPLWSMMSARDTADDVASDVTDALQGIRITAADLNLANKYDFTLWGYCVTPQDGKKNCTKAQFDWASKELNLDWVQRLTEVAQLNVTIPKELDEGLNLYKTITKWTQVVFIIAIVALALELLVGLFTACSRAVSCVVWIISGFATAAIIATAILLTVTGSTVIGLVLGVGKVYGVKASLNTSFLAILWLSVAFALGAGLFWLFSICCCKPENRPHGGRSRHSDSEKLVPNGSYAPLGDNRNSGYSGYNYPAPQRGGARSDLAYEPYSHSRV
ncbi:SUR7 protein [Xylaria bambusicola]|uniref:SUR7 protein n=1 Tax=Xylaria bambusicola TaxID=326684 RepID=UPI002007CC69|nr:SUR7 protein [Xylaria bambusicola]KAI0521546.1 SUR7 protein [Xylaria bambusicola]